MNEPIIRAGSLVSIDTKTNVLTRYINRKATHSAQIESLEAQAIEDFRTSPPDEFLMIISGEAM